MIRFSRTRIRYGFTLTLTEPEAEPVSDRARERAVTVRAENAAEQTHAGGGRGRGAHATQRPTRAVSLALHSARLNGTVLMPHLLVHVHRSDAQPYRTVSAYALP